tara:strand:- start:677 stop:1159 length:483 start_codon:yes stop_codon:yes gene_type:complete
MATPTYTLIQTTTLGSSAQSVTFATIDQSFADLVLVVSGDLGSSGSMVCTLNGDTGSNYRYNFMDWYSFSKNGGYSASTSSLRIAQQMNGGGVVIANFLDYTSYYHKSVISRYANGASGNMAGGLWASQWNGGPITNLQVASNDVAFSAGAVFAIYGIEA